MGADPPGPYSYQRMFAVEKWDQLIGSFQATVPETELVSAGENKDWDREEAQKVGEEVTQRVGSEFHKAASDLSFGASAQGQEFCRSTSAE